MNDIDTTHAVVFPGQGSHFAGMADAWTAHPASAAVLAEASESMGLDLAAACHDEERLASTEFVQPALLACDIAAFKVMEAHDILVAGAAGHSLGEFAALVASGAMTLADALDVVVIRGRAMRLAGEERPGTMAALIGLDAEQAAVLCDDARGDDVLVVANENSPAQVVVSGSVSAVERLQALARDRQVRAVRLNVAGAFHSPLMEPAVAPIVERLASIAFASPRFPIAENVVGTLVEDPEELRTLLGRQVVSPVRWVGCAHALFATGATTFLEAGPGDVLTKLAKRVVPGAYALAIGSPDAAAAFAAGL